MRMKLRFIVMAAVLLLWVPNIAAVGNFYFGIQGGFSAQKPSLKDVEFNTDTTFLVGARAGFKLLRMAVEVDYFQASHNLELGEFVTLDWGDRELNYSFLGINLKYFFSLLLIRPYITAGYGNYKADLQGSDEDTKKGYNFGLGIELGLGKKFSVLAEGKYHRVKLDIQEKDLDLGDFTFCLGINIYF